MIKEPVHIKLTSKIKRDKTHTEIIEKSYNGFISLKNNVYYMQYKDEEIGNVLVKINNELNEIVVNYVNQHQKKMVFNVNQLTQMIYEQQGMNLFLTIKTKLITVNLKHPMHYTIVIKYELFYEENCLGEYELSYSINK